MASQQDASSSHSSGRDENEPTQSGPVITDGSTRSEGDAVVAVVTSSTMPARGQQDIESDNDLDTASDLDYDDVGEIDIESDLYNDLLVSDDNNLPQQQQDNNHEQPQQDGERLRPLQAHAQQLRHRLLRNQRSSILLQVLLHHIVNTRRRRNSEPPVEAPPLPPDRPMPVLSRQEAVETNAICRFCFEGVAGEKGDEESPDNLQDGERTSIEPETATTATISSTTSTPSPPSLTEQIASNTSSTPNSSLDSSNSNNVLIAPCNCSGGSRWVHLHCLQQWQRMQASRSSTTDPYSYAGYVCNVCTSPYLSRPPTMPTVRHNVLKRGTLLVSKNILGRTFQQTVVLLLNDVCASSGAFGLIVNSPLQEELTPSLLETASEQGDQNAEPLAGENDAVDTPPTATERMESSTEPQNENNILQDESIRQVVNSIDWRRGGPVCGGRLGVVQYVIMHTFPQEQAAWVSAQGHEDAVLDVDIDEDYFDDDDDDDDDDDETATHEDNIDNVVVDRYPPMDAAQPADMGQDTGSHSSSGSVASHHHRQPEEDGDDDYHHLLDDDIDDDDSRHHGRPINDEECAPISLPIFDHHRNGNSSRLQFVASNNSQPATFSEENLVNVVQRLVAGSNSNNGSSSGDFLAEGSENEPLHPSTTTTANSDTPQPQQKVVVFSGYCKWRAGQLEREIQRESWSVCMDGTAEDILRDHDSGFWEEISESGRLLSWQRLVEDSQAI